MADRPTTRFRRVEAAVLSWGCLASHALAAVTLVVQTGTEYSPGQACVAVGVSNAGPDTAYALRTEVLLEGQRAASDPVRDVEPHQALRQRLCFSFSPPIPGEYAAVVRVAYRDANGRPFSTVAAVPVVTAEPLSDEGGLSLRLNPAAVAGSATTRLHVANRSGQERTLRVAVVAPDELRCAPPRWDVRLEPRKTAALDIRLENVSALPGSRYPLLAVASLVRDGRQACLTTAASVDVTPPPVPWRLRREGWTALAAILLLAFAARQRSRRTSERQELARPRVRVEPLLSALVVVCVTLFVAAHLAPRWWWTDTLAAGGDTPAHLYLVSHLKESVRSGGGLVSWASGWWCGFPMFQFYFWLPYGLAALASVVLPLNVAFKLLTVAGPLVLPLAAWGFARRLRFPFPVPPLMAAAMIPLLFDRSHQMWGVNLYSTLAGMIANSISFAILLPTLGAAWRDADDGVLRLRTVAWLVALIGSHFFTSVMAAATLSLMPALRPRAGFRRAAAVLAAEGILAALISAWWLVPLVAKQRYTVAFGVNWEVPGRWFLTAPRPWVPPLAALGLVLGLARRDARVLLLAGMGAMALALFFWGGQVSPVFVNIRLWPFIMFSAAALAAYAVGIGLRERRGIAPALVAVVLLAMVWGPGRPNTAAAFARWNYEGLERKPGWPVMERLVLPLRGTPGRFANDLHDANNSLGSSRVFEVLPHLVGKPVLEGGLVNSAEGALFAYYVQSETSRSCAGFPLLTRPSSFNMDLATRHLELFNVKHFLARWEGTRSALASSPAWRRLGAEGSWELYELTTHRGRYVFVPSRPPIAVRVRDRQKAGLDWMYVPGLLDQPFVLLDPDESPPSDVSDVLSEEDFQQRLARAAGDPPTAVNGDDGPITAEIVSDRAVRFTTTAIGHPHIIKCNHFPNWKVRGADRVYRVTPCFMLVYPKQPEVELIYARAPSDWTGLALTWLGLGAAALIVVQRGLSPRGMSGGPSLPVQAAGRPAGREGAA